MMTNDEAIRRIRDHMRVHNIGEYPHIHIKEALDMAIDALNENSKLRANLAQVVETEDYLTNEIVIRFRYAELLNPEETMCLLVKRMQDAIQKRRSDSHG